MTSPDAIADAALISISQWQREAATRRARPRSAVYTVRLLHLDGSPWCSAGFLPGDPPGSHWAWIVETVAREWSVDEDQVGTLETDDGDVVTVDGLPVCRVE